MVKMDTALLNMEQNVIKMGNKVLAMHAKVIGVLEEESRDQELAIIQSDDVINHLEEEINDQAVRCLALLSPVASDLRKVIANIKIASELERIGDYAKNIAIFLIKNDSLDQNVCKYAVKMEQQFMTMLQDTMSAYENRDIEQAFEIPERDKKIKTLYYKLRDKVTTKEEDAFMKQIFELSSMLRNMERAGDHTKNICEHIIYMVKGQHYDFG